MNVLLVTDKLEGGGAERQLVMLAAALQQAGHCVRLLTFYPGVPFYQDLIERSGLVCISDVKGVGRAGRIVSIRRRAREMEADAVVAFKNGTAMAACLAGIGAGWFTVVSERDITIQVSLREKVKFHLYRYADAIVCNSRTQCGFVKSTFPKLSPKTLLIHNFAPSVAERNPEAGTRSPLVLTVGRIARQKNVEAYLHLVTRFSSKGENVRFRWVGDASDSAYFAEMLALRRKLGVEEIVEFIPAVRNVESCYAGATHFLLMSHHEGFSNALCEAVMSGLLCIASDVGDNALILGNRQLTFRSGDIDAAESALRRILHYSQSEAILISTMLKENVRRLTDNAFNLARWIDCLLPKR